MAEVPDIIAERAQAYGLDPGVLLNIARVESGLNPNATAGTSTAKGLFQFTDPTWARYGTGNPTDPYAAADAAARLTKDNSAALEKAGLASDPGSIYLAHFAGPAGAVKLLSADPNASARSILGDAAVKANPFLENMSAADVRSWANRKMGASPAFAPQPASPSVSAAAPGASPSRGLLTGAPLAVPDVDSEANQAILAQLGRIIQETQHATPQFQPLQNFLTPNPLMRMRRA